MAGALFLYLAFTILPALLTAIPIDNAVAAQPEILCLQDSMRILFNTQKPFSGHVYVKGMFMSNPSCHLDLTRSLSQDRKAVFNIPYRSCTTNRERSLRPAGLSYSAVIIIQFHHLFITKVDRAYRLTCFYMESEKIVTQGIHVSMLPTTELADERPMPTCRYEVLAGSLSGPPVRFAKVGDKVFHKWTCESGAHGMLVHSCVARDGAGSAYELVDQGGCAVDPIALGDLTYSNDLTMAFTQVHVFKFADQMVVNFQCPGASPFPSPPFTNPNAPPGPPRYPDGSQVPNFGQGPLGVDGQPIQTYGPDGRPLIPSPLEPRPDFRGERGPLPPPVPAPLPAPQIPGFFPPQSGQGPYPDGEGGFIETGEVPPTGNVFPPGSGFDRGFPGIGPDGVPAGPPLPFALQRRPPVEDDRTTMYPPDRPMPSLSGFGGRRYQEGSGRRSGERTGIQIDPELFGGVEPFETFRPPLPQVAPVQKRAVAGHRTAMVEGTLDVTSEDMIVFNLDDAFPQSYAKNETGVTGLVPRRFFPAPNAEQDVCMSKLVLIQIISAVVLVFASLMTVVAFVQRRYYLGRITRARKAPSY